MPNILVYFFNFYPPYKEIINDIILNQNHFKVNINHAARQAQSFKAYKYVKVAQKSCAKIVRLTNLSYRIKIT